MKQLKQLKQFHVRMLLCIEQNEELGNLSNYAFKKCGRFLLNELYCTV